MTVRNAIAPVFIGNNFVQRFEIIEQDDRKRGPFGVRFESGPELPFATVSRGTDQADRAFIGVLTPFVFLHNTELLFQTILLPTDAV